MFYETSTWSKKASSQISLFDGSHCGKNLEFTKKFKVG